MIKYIKEEVDVDRVVRGHNNHRVEKADSPVTFHIFPCLDLTCLDPFDGKPWDFAFAEERRRGRALFREQEPAVLIGSPCCTAWSPWQ